MSREVWAIVSDLHCNSTLGLCPPGGVSLDKEGFYRPGFEQQKLWQEWEAYWNAVHSVLKSGDRLFVNINGDWVDGDHHNTSQIVSRNMTVQADIAMATLAPALALDPLKFLVIRGTEVHVGQSGCNEESLAQRLPAIGDDKSETYSHWHKQMLSAGVLMDFAHHGRVGTLPHTKSNPLRTLSMKIRLAAIEQGVRAPDVVYRSHCHKGADTYEESPVRVIQTRAWQLATGFVHRIEPGALPEIGGIIQINEDGRKQIIKFESEWAREEPCQTARFVA